MSEANQQKGKRVLYWNEGRPVLVNGNVFTVFDRAYIKENWQVWAKRYGCEFNGGRMPVPGGAWCSQRCYDAWVHGADLHPKSSGVVEDAEHTEAGGCKGARSAGVEYDPLPDYPPGVPSSVVP